jgi:hypothetical protein
MTKTQKTNCPYRQFFLPMAGRLEFDVGGPFCTGDEPIDRRSIRMSLLVDGAPPRH